MALLRLAILTTLLGTVVASVNAQDSPPDVPHRTDQNLRSVLRYLWPVLVADGGVASIYYSTVCHDPEGRSLPFPEVEVHPPSKGKVGLAAIREIFRKDKNVKVSGDQSGMIRIAIGRSGDAAPQTVVGKPQHALLQTKLNSLKFDLSEQYTPHLAIVKIRVSEEFQTALHELNLGVPETLINLGVDQPEEGVPHLAPLLKDMTLEQALDSVAKTFGGVILYGTCDEGAVDFSFVGTGDFDETMNRPTGRKKYGRPISTGQ